jgi:hypothetical protein
MRRSGDLLVISGRGADQHHVVKWRNQAAAIDQCQMHGLFDLRLVGKGRI